MRKFFVFLLIVLLVTPCLAMAHPGRTDSNGGHTDSSTGEYHYHHGYPAHDHYDMDGDGRKDCPYNFDDKTGYNSGSHSSSGNKTNGSTNDNKTTQKPSTSAPVKPATTKKEPLGFWDIVMIIIAAILGLPFVLAFGLSIVEFVRDFFFDIVTVFKPKKKREDESKAPVLLTESTEEPTKATTFRRVEFVGSSTMSSAKYEEGALYITFTEGQKHAYFNVPEDVFDGLVSAADKGSYYINHIYKKYPFGIVHE